MYFIGFRLRIIKFTRIVCIDSVNICTIKSIIFCTIVSTVSTCIPLNVLYYVTMYRLYQHEIKQYKLHFLLIFYLKVSPPIPTHRVPFSTRSYTCGRQSVCLNLCPPLLQNSKTVHTNFTTPLPLKNVHR